MRSLAFILLLLAVIRGAGLSAADAGLGDERLALPDYSKWDKLQIGMTKDEVKKLLGEPLETLGEDRPGYALIYGYGVLIKQSAQIPCDYKYLVNFLDGKVFNIEDPFNRRLSHDGHPLKPEIFLPADRTEFAHYPRVFDIRWFPVSGAYPMSYEVCVSIRLDDGKGGESWEDTTIKTMIPYANFCFAGANDGRIRIRGVNSFGPGPWSDDVHFKFKH